ncbi:helix-turn-helix domain-containing protein [Pseudobacteroides cellulosolvens]|uniref:Transcriptional regulator, CdaR n=1 Tax=Pseudobacteroides cellulosolvens ATCC 35603 = DSM 2933 TaxID=398512 RepID=A0A0L6JNS3_9FIRM|nr:helix-turn-helix domain-containing protein [Pseudobacteroides cellulosolvens]KNY27350.1 transcriptional regulator, CdaR [Pseudobacteroides cellulosolvens ATCC 35603 = DSM 2933]
MQSKIYQNIVSQIRETIDAEFGVMDDSGTIIACSDEAKIGDMNENALEIMGSDEKIKSTAGYSYYKIMNRNNLENIVFLAMDGELGIKFLSLITINIINANLSHEEKLDKTTFIKNIIHDNILPSDVLQKSRELHLSNNVSRVVILIRTGNTKDVSVCEMVFDVVSKLFPNKARDFVVAIDEENIVLIKELKNKDDAKEIDSIAKTILDTLSAEVMINVSIGIGSIAENIRDIKNSYKDAQSAISIGGIFESDKNISNYNNLGIGRLIYQLPPTLCRLFLSEVFSGELKPTDYMENKHDTKSESKEKLDNDTILTVLKFFENNQNVSETARAMYLHRNSVVYRLDKVQRLTGLDIRIFNEAVIFKIALMVKKYLDYSEEQTKNNRN